MRLASSLPQEDDSKHDRWMESDSCFCVVFPAAPMARNRSAPSAFALRLRGSASRHAEYRVLACRPHEIHHVRRDYRVGRGCRRRASGDSAGHRCQRCARFARCDRHSRARRSRQRPAFARRPRGRAVRERQRDARDRAEKPLRSDRRACAARAQGRAGDRGVRRSRSQPAGWRDEPVRGRAYGAGERRVGPHCLDVDVRCREPDQDQQVERALRDASRRTGRSCPRRRR